MKKCVSLILLVCMLSILCGCSQQAALSAAAGMQIMPIAAKAYTASDNAALDTVVDIATTQYFTDEAVSDDDIETIVMAGINAPSAMNGQPWHFSVITDADVLNQINEGMSFGGGMPGGPGGFGGRPDGAAPEGMELPEGFEGMEPPEGFEGMEKPEGFTPPEGFSADPGTGSKSGLTKAGHTDAPLVIVVSCKAGSELDAGLACQNMSAAAQLLGYGSKIISSPTIALNGEKQAEYRELLGIPENMSAVALLLVGVEDSSVDESLDGYTAATERVSASEIVTYVEG